MPLTLAIVGRPNVGKSTLFNRLTRLRQGSGGQAGRAIVDDAAGTTRDRREGRGNLGGLEFTLLDTAGLEEAKEGSLQARMTAQTEAAVDACDAVLFLVDGRAGITPGDEHFAGWLRRQNKPVILLVNKAESGKAQAGIAEAHALGFGEPVAVSAEHGEGMGELYEALTKLQVASGKLQEENVQPATFNLQLAVVGRPNVGKSTLINRIIGQERLLTGPEAGITRDAIAVTFESGGKKFKLVDTAGLRKKANVREKIEKLAVADTIESLNFAEVAVLVMDAGEPLEKQDNMIAALIEQEGRALVIAANKWDTIAEKGEWKKSFERRFAKVLPQLAGAPVVPLSAATGENVDKLLKECVRAHAVWNKQIPTGKLNRWLESAIATHTPPLVKGRRIKLRYMTQKSARPPSFILFSNTSDIPESYLRYLTNSMRQAFDLPGVPIRIKIRKSENPYAKKD